MSEDPERDSIYLQLYVEDMAAREDITGCPVPWCDESGDHWWPHELDGSRMCRQHEHSVWSRLDEFGHGVEISVEMCEASEAHPHDVDGEGLVAVNILATDCRLQSFNEVRQFIAGLLRAADSAFPAGS